MQSVTITAARNKSFIGKVGIITGGEIKIGRTVYNILWGNHQPRKSAGDFAVETSTIEDKIGFSLNRAGKNVTLVSSYEITK
tara:strand:+ start:526 stop:771 length:246 start_codon:yes stop_codon:yes gene_type:complete